MDIVLFYYTLIVMLISILTAATCLSTFLVSRKRVSLFAFFGFFFYFFDVALVFQGDFINQNLSPQADSIYAVSSPLASVIIGTGLLMSFWLMACDFLGERRRAMLITPGILYVSGCCIALFALPYGSWQEFVFYSMRALFLFWMLAFAAFRFLSAKNEVERNRLWRHRRLYALLWILGACVVAENVLLLLVFDLSVIGSGAPPFLPERNFAENALLMGCAFVACRNSWHLLSLRFEKPPTGSDEPLEAHINQNIDAYGRRYHLSEREIEVLRYILLGKDNQNIATCMNLALSTIKVHVHNILQKTSLSNRQELTKDFWKTA